MWIPIFAFVALGFDHVVANMFFMPLGIWMGTPGLTVGLYIWKGMAASSLLDEPSLTAIRYDPSPFRKYSWRQLVLRCILLVDVSCRC